jgi:hypothetical protein
MSHKNDPSYQDLVAGLPVAQGDLLILKMEADFTLPANFSEIRPDRTDGTFTAAHSETGHHHVLRGMIPFDMSGAMEGGGGFGTRIKMSMDSIFAPAPTKAPAAAKSTVRMFRDKTASDSELKSYVVVEGDDAMIEHHRGFHTHAPIYLPSGTYLFARQFRPTPEGLKKVTD